MSLHDAGDGTLEFTDGRDVCQGTKEHDEEGIPATTYRDFRLLGSHKMTRVPLCDECARAWDASRCGDSPYPV